MYLLVRATEELPTISLEEPDDCNRFHVTIRELSQDTAERALVDEGIGHFSDSTTAWIKLAAIRKLAQGRVQPDWLQRFSAMLQYAGRKGWLSEDRGSVSGHCEWMQ